MGDPFVGGFWVSLTATFEFGFFHFVAGPVVGDAHGGLQLGGGPFDGRADAGHLRGAMGFRGHVPKTLCLARLLDQGGLTSPSRPSLDRKERDGGFSLF